MFFIIDTIDIASYADDNIPYSVEKNQCGLESKLQKASVKRFKWFHENGIKPGTWYVTNLCDKASTCKNLPIYTLNTKTTINECLFYVSIWLLSFSLDEPQ